MTEHKKWPSALRRHYVVHGDGTPTLNRVAQESVEKPKTAVDQPYQLGDSLYGEPQSAHRPRTAPELGSPTSSSVGSSTVPASSLRRRQRQHRRDSPSDKSKRSMNNAHSGTQGFHGDRPSTCEAFAGHDSEGKFFPGAMPLALPGQLSPVSESSSGSDIEETS